MATAARGLSKSLGVSKVKEPRTEQRATTQTGFLLHTSEADPKGASGVMGMRETTFSNNVELTTYAKRCERVIYASDGRMPDRNFRVNKVK